MFRNIIFLVVFLLPPFLKVHILRWFCKAQIGRRVYIGWFSSVMGRRIKIGDYSEIRSFTLIKCDQELDIGEYSAVSNFVFIYGAGSFILGNQSYVGPQCLFNVDEALRIGNVSTIGPRTMIFTHSSFLPYTEGYWAKLSGVNIGDYVWIAAGVFIHPGLNIGSSVFINARSVIKNDICDNEVVEGFPAKVVGSMDKMRRVVTPLRLDTISWQMVDSFSQLILMNKMSLFIKEKVNGRIGFSFRGKDYNIICVSSDNVPDLHLEDKTAIFVVTREGWHPPVSARKPLVIDLISKTMTSSPDKIYSELYLFIKRFYGVQLRY